MVKRVVLAGLFGGLAMFAWLAAAHMSPLGEIGVGSMPREILVTETLDSGVGGSGGLYVFPADPEAGPSVPSGFMVFYPDNVMTMTAREPLGELAKDVVQALLLALLLAQAVAAGYLRRLGLAAAAGLMVALTTHGSYHLWYRFPLDFTLADGAITLVAYVVAGAVIAAVLPRRRSAERHAPPA